MRGLRRKPSWIRPRGMAPLELVIGMPFLLLVVATCWSIGSVALGRQAAAMQTRHQGWNQRTDPARRRHAMASLRPTGNLLADQRTRSVRVAGWLGTTKNPESRSAVVVGTWDHRDVPEMGNNGPHVFLFPKLAAQAGSGISAALEGQMNGFYRDLAIELAMAATQ